MQRATQPRRPGPYDQDVGFELLAFNGHNSSFYQTVRGRPDVTPRQLPVGIIPAFSTISITVLSGARVRCITPFGTTVPCRGPSSIVRPSRSINSLPSTT